ncbi:hypothetical protein HU200_034057 [Digitaria exilis]|uniref:Uncharacterized protein n=1 Tax=Digitaria exilis TaxID=1010633 RepID=A0A835BVZ6_9POAL|nr:hypothetical protein HU200_034057 [Digitaria exilis]
MHMRPISHHRLTARPGPATLAAAKTLGVQVRISNCPLLTNRNPPTAPTPPASQPPLYKNHLQTLVSEYAHQKLVAEIAEFATGGDPPCPTRSHLPRRRPLMSCLSLQRRSGPPPPPAARVTDDASPRGGGKAEEKYWERVLLLEEEIRRLSMWFGHEERPAPRAAEEGVVRAQPREEEVGATAAFTGERATNGAKRCAAAAGDHGVKVKDTVRLEDRSYLREVTRVGRPFRGPSPPSTPPACQRYDDCMAFVCQILDKMAAMRAEDLCKFLTQMMPLKDITGQKNPGEPARRMTNLSSGDDLVEALVFRAMDKLESLVLEGLKIQMASPATEPATTTAAGDRSRNEEVAKDCMVHVVLMQVRDPNEGYSSIGDPMIGLIEASLEKKDGVVKLEMLGLHVAGISFISRKPSDGRCMLWSASLRQCRGSRAAADGGGCRCTCVRNPNRVFKR